jgi:hypothetical protein
MLHPRVLFLGDPAAAAPYVGIAKKLARETFDARIRNKTYTVGEATIRVENTLSAKEGFGSDFTQTFGGISKVWIQAGSSDAGYQFFGSSPLLDKSYGIALPAEYGGGTRYVPKGFSAFVSVRAGALVNTPLVSSELAPPDNEWRYDADPTNTYLYLRSDPFHQWDGRGVHQWRPALTTNTDQRWTDARQSWLLTQWQQPYPCLGQGARSGGVYRTRVTTDAGYDFGPTVFKEGARKGVPKIPDAGWYERAGMQTVVSTEFGTRRFIVMVDFNQRFYCYPTNGYGPEFLAGQDVALGEKANVPTELTQSQACPWPAWVTPQPTDFDVGDTATWLRPVWSFSPDGLKAVCVAAHRAEAWADSEFTSTFYDNAGQVIRTLQEDYPGLVEVGFTIALTGTNPEDFTFAVNLLYDACSQDTLIAPVAAVYTNSPIGAIAENSLVVLEYQHYTDNPSFTIADPLLVDDPSAVTPARPNFTTIANVRVRQDSVWSVVRQWLAHYGAYPLDYKNPGYRLGERKFTPQLEDYHSLAVGDVLGGEEFSFTTQINAMELETLSFCLAGSAYTMGWFTPTVGDSETYGIEGATVVVIAFNVEQERQSVGHDLMKAETSLMLDLQGSYPVLDDLTPFYLNATLDQTEVAYPWPPYSTTDWLKKTANLTVRNGDGVEMASLIQWGFYEAWRYLSFSECPLFTGYDSIYAPRVFSYFDIAPFIRPGVRWEASGSPVAGESSFTDYPYGIIFHHRVLHKTILALNNTNTRFSTHPRSQSWAICVGPFSANAQTMKVSEPPIPHTLDQAIIDRIQLRVWDSATAAYVLHDTSHRAALNSAFNQAWAEEDYYFNTREGGDGIPEFKPASLDATAHSWYDLTTLVPKAALWSSEYQSGDFIFPLACFSDTFMDTVRHLTYDPAITFPTPRMEAYFV